MELCRRYKGYNKNLVDRYCQQGFEIKQVIQAFEFVGIDRAGGKDYELEEAYQGDVLARLYGES